MVVEFEVTSRTRRQFIPISSLACILSRKPLWYEDGEIDLDWEIVWTDIRPRELPSGSLVADL